MVGFWEYGSNSSIVMVDQDGAGVIACADTPGDQLRHLGCPFDGPCEQDQILQ